MRYNQRLTTAVLETRHVVVHTLIGQLWRNSTDSFIYWFTLFMLHYFQGTTGKEGAKGIILNNSDLGHICLNVYTRYQY